MNYIIVAVKEETSLVVDDIRCRVTFVASAPCTVTLTEEPCVCTVVTMESWRSAVTSTAFDDSRMIPDSIQLILTTTQIAADPDRKIEVLISPLHG